MGFEETLGSKTLADLTYSARRRNAFKYVFYVPAVIVILVGLYFIIPLVFSALSGISLSGKASCETQECFINAANECEKASFKQTEEGSVFYYKEKDCVLTKKITELDVSEPQEIKDLLENKAMTCNYEKGYFNTDWITTLSIGIDSCDGELKDAVTELIYAI